MTLAIAVHMAQEVGGFGIDPSADGSGYTAVRTAGPVSAPKRTRRMLDQGWSVGRLRRVRHRAGPDGAELTLSMPWHGYAAAALEGASPSTTLDAPDMVLAAAWGAGTLVAGLGANSVTATSFVSAGDDRNVGDALAIYQAGVNGDRAQLRVIDAEPSAGTYTVRSVLGTFTTAAFSFGMRRWRPAVVPSAANGPSLAVHVELVGGAQWTLLGGRPTGAMRLVVNAGEEARLEVTLSFTIMTRQNKASRPAVTTFSPPAIMGELASVVWGGTEYETSSVTIEWSLGTAERPAVTSVNGRSNIVVRTADCKVSIAPPYGTSWEDDFVAATVRRLEVVLGSGVLAGGAVNASFLWLEAAQVASDSTDEDGNEARESIEIAAADGVIGGAVAPYWSLARL